MRLVKEFKPQCENKAMIEEFLVWIEQKHVFCP